MFQVDGDAETRELHPPARISANHLAHIGQIRSDHLANRHQGGIKGQQRYDHNGRQPHATKDPRWLTDDPVRKQLGTRPFMQQDFALAQAAGRRFAFGQFLNVELFAARHIARSGHLCCRTG